MAKITKKKFATLLTKHKKRLWECLRRNSHYIKSFSELNSLDSKIGKKARLKRFGKFYDIASSFIISAPIDPKREFDEEIAQNIELVWLRFPNSSFESPIRPSSFRVIDGQTTYNIGKLRKAKRSEALEKGRYITIKIDASAPPDLIQGLVTEAVSMAKKNLTDDVDWGAERNRSDEDFQYCLKVWDLNIQGVSKFKIASEVFNKDLENARHSVKRYLKRVQKLIEATKYPTKKEGG